MSETVDDVMVYIASPYTIGDTPLNVRKSLEVANELAECGFTPFAPLLTMFWHMIFPHVYSFWLNYDLRILRRCDCMLRLPGESHGADKEVALAKQLGIPVFYCKEALKAHYGKAA